jgi:hypothetical protein
MSDAYQKKKLFEKLVLKRRIPFYVLLGQKISGNKLFKVLLRRKRPIRH